MDKYRAACRSGKSKEKTLEPSSGGIGKRLNIAMPVLIESVRNKNKKSTAVGHEIGIICMPEKKSIFSKIPATVASRRLVIGPASETRAQSLRLSLRLKISTGTGLAPPYKMGE